MFKRFKLNLSQFRVTRCIVIIINLGCIVMSEVRTNTVGTRLTIVKKSIGTIILYNPRTIIKLILTILPIGLNFIPILNAMPIVKMIIIYGLDFVIV